MAPLPYDTLECTERWLYEDLQPRPSAEDVLILQHGAHVHVDAQSSLDEFATFARAALRFALRFPGDLPIMWIEPLPQH